MTTLFFDDTRLYDRQGMTREYGIPEVVAKFEYPNDLYAIQWCNGLWRTEDGVYHMILLLQADGGKFVPIAYYGTDGEHWTEDNRAEECGIRNIHFPNQCFDADMGIEPAFFFMDLQDTPDKRYKCIANKVDAETHWCDDIMYSSPDGFHWSLMQGAHWNSRGAEPGVSCFHNDVIGKDVVVCRPTWGDRRICMVETENYQNFSYPRLALQPDSEDDPLVELYGMMANPYKNYYLGFLWLYHGIHSTQNKFWEGNVDVQLTYSLNGLHWQRSLRRPFLANGEKGSYYAGMLYPSKLLQLDDGSLRFYAGTFANEHGHFYSQGTFVTYKLREDGFIKLVAGKEGGSVFLRPMVLNGPIDVNLSGKATCALYNSAGSAPLKGFEYSDCVPFDGDATHWVPRWNGDITKLYGKTVCMEIKLESGELFAVNGAFTPITVHEARRFDKFGTLLNGKGF